MLNFLLEPRDQGRLRWYRPIRLPGSLGQMIPLVRNALSGWPRVCAGVSGDDPRMISIMSYLAWSIALGFRLDKVGGPTELPPG